MKIGIVAHPTHGEALKLAKEICNYLSGEEFELSEKTGEKMDMEGAPIEEMDVDSIITVGGDGTVLYTVNKMPETPILGINMGKRGFLADVKPGEALEAVDKVREGKLGLKERERISVKVSGEKIGEALNEGVIRSHVPSQLLSFKIKIDGTEAETNEGDGLIVSTPTGSTAYALAAGGSVIDPRVKANIIVPLSTYVSRGLPLVYPTGSNAEVELLETKGRVDITLDGLTTKTAEEGDIIKFERSENKAKFYEWNINFYDKVREKL